MSRYADEDALIKRMPSVMDMQDAYLPAPSIDIVLCEECVFSYRLKDGRLFCDSVKGLAMVVSANDFCSYGERGE